MTSTAAASAESVFTYGTTAAQVRPRRSDEIGFDLSQYGVRRALVVTDPGVAATGIPARVASQVRALGIEAVVFDGVRGGADGCEHGRGRSAGQRAVGHVRRDRPERNAPGSTAQESPVTT